MQGFVLIFSGNSVRVVEVVSATPMDKGSPESLFGKLVSRGVLNNNLGSKGCENILCLKGEGRIVGS